MVETKSLEATRKRWEAAIGRVPAAYSEGIAQVTNFKEKALAGQQLLDALHEVELGPKTKDPLQNVDNRVKPIVARLAKLKEE